MSEENVPKPGRIVSLGTVMTPQGKLEHVAVRAPFERTDVPRKTMTPQEARAAVDNAVMRGTPGGLLLARILTMPEHEKLQVIEQAMKEDTLILWFALLPKAVRAHFVQAAMNDLKETAH